MEDEFKEGLDGKDAPSSCYVDEYELKQQREFY